MFKPFLFSPLDVAALLFFIGAWFIYSVLVERSVHGQKSLNIRMNAYRHRWIEQLTLRDNRIMDTSIMASLQNGTAFFASTSLLAVGGSLALMKSPDEVLTLFSELPFAASISRGMWEVKVIGLAVIFVYAFFKFAWAYRIFNYASILVGCIPNNHKHEEAETIAARTKTARMTIAAGNHFNRGQRAFFFALGYLGWFISAGIFIIATACVLYVMWRRQFISDACTALD
jgi:uncharacterized membrane protein